MISAYQESQRRREFRLQVERNIERLKRLNDYLEGRRENPSPSTLYKPTHGGYPGNENGAGI